MEGTISKSIQNANPNAPCKARVWTRIGILVEQGNTYFNTWSVEHVNHAPTAQSHHLTSVGMQLLELQGFIKKSKSKPGKYKAAVDVKTNCHVVGSFGYKVPGNLGIGITIKDINHTTTTASPVEKPKPVTPNWAKEWGIDSSMNLRRECANFYTLYDLSLDFEDVKPKFNEVRNKLAQQFTAYLDMALGGELRHCRGSASSAGLKELTQASDLNKAVIDRIKGDGQKPERKEAWCEWRQVRTQYGLDALKVARDTFNKVSWNASMGGKRWGQATEVLLDWLEGNSTETLFVDTVWSLQHNCNVILDKVWDVSGLNSVLNAKFNGKIEEIVGYANIEVQKLWQEKKHGMA